MKKVLDGGYIELVDFMGTDKTIVNTARISYGNDKNEQCQEDELIPRDRAIIDKMVDGKFLHWTPFAQTTIKLKIKMPIFVARQWFRHNVGFVRNELSRRYTKKGFDFYIPPFENIETREIFKTVCEKMFNCYDILIEKGVNPEDARVLLPQGTYTIFYETGNLISYFNLWEKRADFHSQAEINLYANALDEILTDLFPYSWDKLKQRSNNGI